MPSGIKAEPIPKDLLVDLYVRQGLTLLLIANKIGITLDIVRRAMIKHGIDRRPKRPRIVDITGQRFNSLVITKMICRAKSATLCEARCDCGVVKVYQPGAIKKGVTKTCGCAKLKNGWDSKSWRGHGEISASRWEKIQMGARERSLEFSITIEQAWDLFIKQNRRCAMTGIEISFSPRNDSITTASLDRIDSSIGYTIENIQWVHKTINRMKFAMPQEEFIYFCKKVASHSK